MLSRYRVYFKGRTPQDIEADSTHISESGIVTFFNKVGEPIHILNMDNVTEVKLITSNTKRVSTPTTKGVSEDKS